MRIVILLFVAAMSYAQPIGVKIGVPPIGHVAGGFSPLTYEAFYPFGPDINLAANADVEWPDAPSNLLDDSGDMTGDWVTATVTVDDATHLTFTGQYGRILQRPTTVEGQSYTLYQRARRVTGNTGIRAYHEFSASGSSTLLTFTDTLADYATTVLGRTGGGTIDFGLQDSNAAGHGQIEVTRWAVFHGTLTASECAAAYEQTTDRQIVSNHAIPASQRVNLIEHSGDWTESVWVNGAGTPVVTATTVQDDSASVGEAVKQVFTPDPGVDYTASVRVPYAASGAASSLQFYDLGPENEVCRWDVTTGDHTVVAGTPTCTSYLSGGYWTFALEFVSVDGTSGAVYTYPCNAAPSDTCTVTMERVSVMRGEYTATEAAAAYQAKTSANYNWLDATAGADSSAATDDPSDLIGSNQLLTLASGADLTTGWTGFGGATIDDSDTATFTTNADSLIYNNFTWVAGSTYMISATLDGSTNVRFRLYDGASQYSSDVPLTATPTRYSWVVTAASAAAGNIALENGTTNDAGTINATNIMLHQVPTGYTGDPLPFEDSLTYKASRSEFDGVDDLASVTSSSLQLGNSISILALIRKDVNGAQLGIVGRGGGGEDYEYGLYVDANDRLVGLILTAAGSNHARQLGTVGAIPAGLWHVVGMTWSTGEVPKIYLNGVSGDATPFGPSGTHGAGNAATLIGKQWTGGSVFNGSIPLVAVDDRAMTAAQVLAATCEIAEKYWDDGSSNPRKIPVFGALDSCPDLAFE